MLSDTISLSKFKFLNFDHCNCLKRFICEKPLLISYNDVYDIFLFLTFNLKRDVSHILIKKIQL